MAVKDVQELLVFQRAEALLQEISSLLGTSKLRADRVLSLQMDRASLSVLSNVAEGFAQPSDRAFARFLYMSRASVAELRTQILVARLRGHVTPERAHELDRLAEEVARMLTGLIKYLVREDRRRRG
jgi:four helix bundle protein